MQELQNYATERAEARVVEQIHTKQCEPLSLTIAISTDARGDHLGDELEAWQLRSFEDCER